MILSINDIMSVGARLCKPKHEYMNIYSKLKFFLALNLSLPTSCLLPLPSSFFLTFALTIPMLPVKLLKISLHTLVFFHRLTYYLISSTLVKKVVIIFFFLGLIPYRLQGVYNSLGFESPFTFLYFFFPSFFLLIPYSFFLLKQV